MMPHLFTHEEGEGVCVYCHCQRESNHMDDFGTDKEAVARILEAWHVEFTSDGIWETHFSDVMSLIEELLSHNLMACGRGTAFAQLQMLRDMYSYTPYEGKYSDEWLVNFTVTINIVERERAVERRAIDEYEATRDEARKVSYCRDCWQMLLRDGYPTRICPYYVAQGRVVPNPRRT